jgi:ABC-2 type transport system permease protein
MHDSLTMAGRSLRISARQVDGLITALVLPVLLMLMFVELFGGAIDTGTKYVTYVVPGLMLVCAGYSSGLTAGSVSRDMTGGSIDRLRSMDVRATAVLGGHVAASVARNAASAVLVLAVALVLGFHPHAGAVEWLAAAGVLLAFVTAISWLSATLGLLADSPDAATGLTMIIMFLPYASSAFVPVHTMPAWLHGFAEHQPITPVTETLRGLLLGTPVGSQAWVALAWCAGITVASIALAHILFARRVR